MDTDSEQSVLLRKDHSDNTISSRDELSSEDDHTKYNVQTIGIPSKSSELASINDLLAEKYEKALTSTGFGPFSIFLLLFCGITLMADTTEILCVSFVMPSAERSLCLSDWEKGLIGSVIFLGMLIGGYTWGALADQIGRRTCLFFSITMNGVFGLASAFVEHSISFGILRFLSGVGVGASLPVVFSFYAEFLTKKLRGRLISWLSVFWMCGQITTSLFALAVIPRDFNIQVGNYTLYSWRFFVCLCTIPAFLSSFLSLIIPESPRYLLVKGKKEKSLKVLKLIYRMNNYCKFKKSQIYPNAITSLFSDQAENLLEPKLVTPNSPLSLVKSSLHKIKQVVLATLHLFSKQLYFRSIILLLVVFMMSFSTYGIILWFPEYVKSLQVSKKMPIKEKCSNTTLFPHQSDGVYTNLNLCDCLFDTSRFYSNNTFSNCTFSNVHFKNLEFGELVMRNVTIENSEFENISFHDFHLENSTLKNTLWTSINMTDLTISRINSTLLNLENSNITEGVILFSELQGISLHSSRLTQVSFINSTLTGIQYDSNSRFNITNKNSIFQYSQTHNPNCPIKFNEDYDHNKLYLESLYFSLANLPGNLFTVLLIDFIPRKWILSAVLLLSAASVFTLWQVPNETVSVILLCIFNGVNVISWNAFNVLSAELYPTVIRSTAAGVLSAINRIGAIIGVNLFGAFIGITPAVPILTVAVMLIASSIISLRLPRLEKESLK